MELLARTCRTDTMNVQRILARVFVVIGGLFWVFMAWGAAWAYQGAPFTEALRGALFYAALLVVVFVVGMYYEYIAAIILAAFAVGIVVWGVVSGWESGVWATMFFVTILPAMIAAVLYSLAARMQRICTL